MERINTEGTFEFQLAKNAMREFARINNKTTKGKEPSLELLALAEEIKKRLDN